MKYLCSSREFSVLESHSDVELAGPPAEYLSDLVDSPTKESTAFVRRLKTAKTPDAGFVCAVIRVASSSCQADREKVTDCFESTFQCVFQASPRNKTSEKSSGSSSKKTGTALKNLLVLPQKRRALPGGESGKIWARGPLPWPIGIIQKNHRRKNFWKP